MADRRPGSARADWPSVNSWPGPRPARVSKGQQAQPGPAMCGQARQSRIQAMPDQILGQTGQQRVFPGWPSQGQPEICSRGQSPVSNCQVRSKPPETLNICSNAVWIQDRPARTRATMANERLSNQDQGSARQLSSGAQPVPAKSIARSHQVSSGTGKARSKSP